MLTPRLRLFTRIAYKIDSSRRKKNEILIRKSTSFLCASLLCS